LWRASSSEINGSAVEATASTCQRAIGARRRSPAIPAAPAVGRGPFGHGAEAPLVARLSSDDVDHATHRLRTVEHRHRPAHDLDAVDVLDGEPVVLEVRRPDHPVAGTDAAAVDEEQRVPAVHAAHADHLAATDRAALHRQAGFASDGLEHVVGAARLDVASRHHAQRRRRVHREHGMARRRDHDDLGGRRFVRCLCPRSAREQRRHDSTGPPRDEVGASLHGRKDRPTGRPRP
jgi:hypothetical protein